MKTAACLVAFALASTASAFNYTIGVGKDETTGLAGTGFDPSRVANLQQGDILVFSFLGGEHQVRKGSAVESTWDDPCSPSGNFDTGLQTVPNGTLEGGGPSFSFTVNNVSRPLWFTDLANNNCYRGAIFCVDTDELSPQNCTSFKQNAIAEGGGAYYTSTSHSALSSTSAPSTSTSTSTSTGPSSSASTSASKSSAGMKLGLQSGAGVLAGVVCLLGAIIIV